MIELERTFLAKYLPASLKACSSKEIIDRYIPKELEHSQLRIRKSGNLYQMTKKEPVKGQDSSEQTEQTIRLREDEYNTLVKLPANVTHKIRCYYKKDGATFEFDVFQGDKNGLVMIDVEFKTSEEKAAFKMPDFCLAEVTQDKAFAGGVLCAKMYADLEPELNKHGYKKLVLE